MLACACEVVTVQCPTRAITISMFVQVVVHMPAPPKYVQLDWLDIEYVLTSGTITTDANTVVSVARARDLCGDGICGPTESGTESGVADTGLTGARCEADCPLVSVCPGSVQSLAQQAGQLIAADALTFPRYNVSTTSSYPRVCSGFGSCDIRQGVCQCNEGAHCLSLTHAVRRSSVPEQCDLCGAARFVTVLP